MSYKKYIAIIRKDQKLHIENIIAKQLKRLTPNTIFYGPTRKHIPYEIMLTDYAGRNSLFSDILSDNHIDFFAIGDSIRKLHQLKPIARLTSYNSLKQTPDFFCSKIKNLKNRFPCLTRDFLHHLPPPVSIETPMVISHNNLRYQNILLNEGTLTIIDFQNVGYNIKEFDLDTLSSNIEKYNPLTQKSRRFLIEHLRTNPMSVVRHKQKILNQCSDITGYSFSRFQNPEYQREALQHIIEGYGTQISKDLLLYCDRILRLGCLIIYLWDSLYTSPEKSVGEIQLIDAFMLCSTIPLSRDSIYEIASYIKTQYNKEP